MVTTESEATTEPINNLLRRSAEYEEEEKLSGTASYGKNEFEALKEWILQHPKVAQAPHRFGGVEFDVDGFEFMHFHGQIHLDIRLSKNDQARMLKEGKAQRHLYAPQAGYVTFRIRSGEDVGTAKELIELAYKNAHETMERYRERTTKTSNRKLGTESIRSANN